VTRLDDAIYVVCRESSTIRLYNTDSQSPLNVINVKGMNNPRDIVVCCDDRQLYIAEPRCIWRVSVDDLSYVKWLTTQSFYCRSLSLTSRRLLVTSLHHPVLWPTPRLYQYNTTARQLLRVVSMLQDMSLYHGVETTRGTFVVGQWVAVSELFSFVECGLSTLFATIKYVQSVTVKFISTSKLC